MTARAFGPFVPASANSDWSIMSTTKQHLLGGALSLCLGLVLLVWLIPNWVEPDPDLRLPVSLVPQIIAIGFVLCGLATLAQVLYSKQVTRTAGSGFDDGEFSGFIAMILVLLAATVGFQFLPFLIVAPLLVAVAMWMFGPLHLVSLVLTSVLGPLAIWFIGTDILGRVLP